MTRLTPTIFFGHGNPLNALAHNVYTDAWRLIGQRVPKPKAILCISAHWYVPGTGVTIDIAPRTITILAGFRLNFMRCNTRHPESRDWHAELSSFWRRSR